MADLKPDLTIDSILLPLDCYFIGCESAWVSETRRHLKLMQQADPELADQKSLPEIRWHAEGSLPKSIAPNSFVALAVDLSDIQSTLRTIHELGQKKRCGNGNWEPTT